MSGLLAVINGGCHNARLNRAEGKKWGSSVDTRTRMLMQYNLPAVRFRIRVYIYIHIFICYTFNILFIYIHQRIDCRSRIMDIRKKLSLKVIDKKLIHALSYFLGLLGNLIEVRL